MTEETSIPDREVLENEVRQVLERARRRTGASVDRMVARLGDLQARGAGTRRSWYDWQERPETVSALTTLGALHLLGPAGTLEVLFARQSGSRDAEPEPGDATVDRLAEVEHQLATLASIVRTLQESVEVIQEDLLREGSRTRRRASVDETPTQPG